MKIYRAFSLIELMVVIAIVAILAAVAVPAYKKHLIGARIASEMVIAEGLMQKAIEYSAKHGHFPSAEELGFQSIIGTHVVAEPDASQIFGPYYESSPTIGAWGGSNGIFDDNCGQYGRIVFSLDATKLGFSPNEATNLNAGGGVDVICEYWHYNGVVSHVCYYQYRTASEDGTDEFVPGYFNFASPKGEAIWQSNYQHMFDATCQ